MLLMSSEDTVETIEVLIVDRRASRFERYSETIGLKNSHLALVANYREAWAVLRDNPGIRLVILEGHVALDISHPTGWDTTYTLALIMDLLESGYTGNVVLLTDELAESTAVSIEQMAAEQILSCTWYQLVAYPGRYILDDLTLVR